MKKNRIDYSSCFQINVSKKAAYKCSKKALLKVSVEKAEHNSGCKNRNEFSLGSNMIDEYFSENEFFKNRCQNSDYKLKKEFELIKRSTSSELSLLPNGVVKTN